MKLFIPQKRMLLNRLLSISDLIERHAGIGSNLIPPKQLWAAYGSANLYESGLAFFKYFLDYCELDRSAKILDIGCSIGRMAIPLTAYLDEGGQYEGFDIMPDSIEYCKKHIMPSFPNFNFQLADIQNSYYNPEGSQQPESYKFPFPDNHFDLVFSTSVFTHLLPEGIEHYLHESYRVLKNSGYALHTFFLLDDESLNALSNKNTKVLFPYKIKDYMVANKNIEEAVVAFRTNNIIDMHKSAGFEISGDIHYGHWRNKNHPARTYYTSRKSYTGFQDMIVSKK